MRYLIVAIGLLAGCAEEMSEMEIARATLECVDEAFFGGVEGDGLPTCVEAPLAAAQPCMEDRGIACNPIVLAACVSEAEEKGFDQPGGCRPTAHQCAWQACH